nr:hypothetical protein CFP56_78136 [Quercus suber]
MCIEAAVGTRSTFFPYTAESSLQTCILSVLYSDITLRSPVDNGCGANSSSAQNNLALQLRSCRSAAIVEPRCTVRKGLDKPRDIRRPCAGGVSLRWLWGFLLRDETIVRFVQPRAGFEFGFLQVVQFNGKRSIAL